MQKPWPSTGGPVVATELEVRRAEAIHAMLVRPTGILPSKPGDPIRPFAIGLFDDIKLLLRPGTTISKLRHATASFVYSGRYYLACGQPDAKRHDISGTAVGDVTPEDRIAAQEAFHALQAAHGKAPQCPEPAPNARSSRIRSGLLPRKGSTGT